MHTWSCRTQCQVDTRERAAPSGVPSMVCFFLICLGNETAKNLYLQLQSTHLLILWISLGEENQLQTQLGNPRVLKLLLEIPVDEKVESNEQKTNKRRAKYFLRKQISQQGVQVTRESAATCISNHLMTKWMTGV